LRLAMRAIHRRIPSDRGWPGGAKSVGSAMASAEFHRVSRAENTVNGRIRTEERRPIENAI